VIIRTYAPGLVAALLFLFALNDLSCAQVIAIKFETGVNGEVDPITATTGVVPVAIAGWNEIAGNVGTNAAPIFDSTGTVIPDATLSFTSNNSYSSTNTNLGGLLDSYIDSGNIVVTLTNIPYAEYDVYAYVGSDGNNRDSAGGTVGSETLSFSTASRDATSFTLTADPSQVYPLANVLLFTNVSGSTLTYTQVGAVAGLGNGLNGLEIVQVTAPEPSTYALMLAGVALLGFCVRRRCA
jgi:hypothetical protein